MTTSGRIRRLASRGCVSETGKLRKVVMCSPTYFQILKPINAIQWLYHCDGLPRPQARTMVLQHQRLVETLREEGVDVELLPPIESLPYQHATRDVGVVIGDTIVLSSLREEIRRAETQVTESILEGHEYGLRILKPKPEQGFVEGGDVIVDGERLWVGIGSRTDERGAEFLDLTFGRDFDIIPLRFGPIYTHLDTIFGALGQGHAILYEPAFESSALQRIREIYPSVISLTEEEQRSAGANVLCLSRNRLISIAENQSVNEQLLRLGYEVVTIPFSEVIKSGGSVRCDTLPVGRDD
jgi:N-dimethylarginine dimethylaminohydrolase